MDFKTFTQVQRNSSQELYGFLPENAAQNSTANPLTTLTPISERTYIDENSCNAVDIPLAGQANVPTTNIKRELSQFLCFNGHFNQKSTEYIEEVTVEHVEEEEENAVDFLLNISADAPENTFVEQMTEDEGDGGGKVIVAAAKKVTFEESMMSPDLFGDDDDDDDDNEPPTITQTITEEPELNESAEVEAEKNCKFIQKREKQVYKRMKSSLSGVIPPPSVINANSDLMEAIFSNRTTILESFEKLRSGNPDEGEVLFKPSHTQEQIDNLEWNDIQHVNFHGIQ